MSSHLVPPLCHAISFFENPEQLCREIARFVDEGLDADQPALVVTNEVQHRGITRELANRGVNVEAVIARGDLLLMDADETLVTIMNGGDLPDSAVYHESIGAACAQLLRGRPGPLRIFGDMVDLLWQRGQYDAAIRIEILSNELAAIHPISVICGYSMGHFLKTAAKLDAVTVLHGRVQHPPGGATGKKRPARATVAADRRRLASPRPRRPRPV